MTPTDTATPAQWIQIAQYTLLVTGIIVALGGVMGFVKAKSKISLIAGGASGLLLVICFFASQTATRYGLAAGAILCGSLFYLFISRLAKTKKFMPSGVMLIICGIAHVVVMAGLLKEMGLI